MATHELTTKSAHESIIGDSRGRSTVTRRLALNMLVSAAVAGTAINATAAATADPIFAAIERHKAAGVDPVFGLIEAHRTATALHSAALKEQARIEQMDVPGAWEMAGKIADGPCHADWAAWRELVNTAPQTFAGLRAWAFYLDEVRGKEEWMLEEEAPAIVMTLARSLERLAVAS